MYAEKEITSGIRKGDIQQFEILFRSSYAPLVRYAASIIKDPDTAEEIVQELFYRLWKDREKISINTSPEGYLYRSVHNMCLHHLDHMKVVDRHNTEMAYKYKCSQLYTNSHRVFDFWIANCKF